MHNITLDPLASSGVEGTIPMQPQMVARGYQNPLGTHNSFLGSTSRGNPLPCNVNNLGENNASRNKNANCNYPSLMGGNVLEGLPLIYPLTMPRGNPPIKPIPQWSGHASKSNQYFWIQPPQGGNIPWNSNQNQG